MPLRIPAKKIFINTGSLPFMPVIEGLLICHRFKVVRVPLLVEMPT